jgi:hypothetical protein
MEEETPLVLSKNFKNLVEVLDMADRNKPPRTEDERKLFRTYGIIKKYLNYQTDDSKDIPNMLQGSLDLPLRGA